MLQLVYISTSREAVTGAMLDDILTKSRRNNDRVGVTGLLLTANKRFLQALEGPDAAVLATYSRIQADPRHYACVLLSSRTVETRSFGEWSMNHHAGGPIGTAQDLRSVVAAITSTLENRTLKAQFEGFAEVHSKAA